MNRATALVLAIDPGLMCGWSLGRGEHLEQFGEAKAFEFLDTFAAMLASGDLDRVVAERLDPRRWDNDMKRTVEISGAIRWWAYRCGFTLAEVNAADKKRTINEVPAEVKSHARDAESIRLWDLYYGTW
ncbi:hypothetical protein LCGC14_0810120 [marine sediment metagenome]|uniref:Uncharacterized protein n=1 Tax=marine sediment metagenome TaxID=412755 RepID=A0A0F9S767_9ZZZZ